MECKGHIKEIINDFNSNGILVTMALIDASVQEIQTFKALELLSVTIKKFHKKRSLDANAYCWVLMGKIAAVIGSSKEEVYEEMLRNYGYYYEDDTGYVTIVAEADKDISKIPVHCKFYRSDGKFKYYLMLKGSSQYDSVEMAHFIDSIIQEARDLGIQTETPDEIERMKALWKGDVR